MNKKYVVRLTTEQRVTLTQLTRTGATAAAMQRHARILLKADTEADGPAWHDDAIAAAAEVSRPTVERVRRQFALHGLDAALQRKPTTCASQRKLDNLNTHTPGALYATFTQAEAKRIWDRLELHYTPKHGIWLNMAEIELSVLARQCLDRHIPDQDALRAETAAWVERRNTAHATIDWRFTTADARIKLMKLYPTLKTSI